MRDRIQKLQALSDPPASSPNGQHIHSPRELELYRDRGVEKCTVRDRDRGGSVLARQSPQRRGAAVRSTRRPRTGTIRISKRSIGEEMKARLFGERGQEKESTFMPPGVDSDAPPRRARRPEHRARNYDSAALVGDSSSRRRAPGRSGDLLHLQRRRVYDAVFATVGHTSLSRASVVSSGNGYYWGTIGVLRRVRSTDGVQPAHRPQRTTYR